MVFLRVTQEDFVEFLKNMTPGVWVETNLIPPTNGVGLWIMEYTGSFELRKQHMLFQRAQAGAPPQDLAMCTFHWANLTGGVPDGTWTPTDYETVEALTDAFWTALKPNYSPDTVLAGYRWSPDGPAFKPFGSALAGTSRNTLRSVVGTASVGNLPPQVAVTITEVTSAKYIVQDVEGVGDQLRNRWGRIYLPAPIPATVGGGRVTSAFCEAVAGAIETCYEAAIDADFIPVMYSPTTGHAWSIDEIHVDDIFDVVRRRRFTTPTARHARAIS